MVIIHDIQGSTTEISSQHNKCKACNGSKTDCLEFVKCSKAICGKQYHVRCIESLNDTSELAEKDFWYCTDKCEQEDEPNRTLQSTSTTALQAHIRTLQFKLDQSLQETLRVNTSNSELLKSFKRLENEVAKMRLSSTFVAPSSAVNDVTFDASASHITANLDSSIDRLLEMSHISQPPVALHDKSSSASTSQASNDLTAKDSQQAHAIASILLSLSERRKHLPELPEFHGKGSEWLCFRNAFNKLRQLGKYDDDEMMAKLRKALKSSAFDYARIWLFSARSNPTQIILDLEEKFFSPSAVITDSFDAIIAIHPIKEKSRASLEQLKRAVDEYVNVCNDVDETIHLTGRVTEAIEDKLPDDLLEDWIKKIRTKEFRGDWYNLSHFLSESTRDLKVRAVDRKKLKISPSPFKSSSPAIARVNVTMIGDSPPCDYDQCGKPLYRCERFAKRSYDIKLANCRLKDYCSRCLRKGHPTNSCPNADKLPSCKIPDCKSPQQHTTLMHPPEDD